MLQRRRLRTGRQLQCGVVKPEAAQRLEVTRATISMWNAQQPGDELDCVKGLRCGRTLGLGRALRRDLILALKAGALSECFPRVLCTPPPVGQLIKGRFGGAYGEFQVRRLCGSLGFSCQPPLLRSLTRNAPAIARCKQAPWPVLKGTPQSNAASSSSSMSLE
jgi:transposase